MSLLDGFFSLAAPDNKVKEPQEQGAVSALTPELTLEMKDDELIVLKNAWHKSWTEYQKELKVKQDKNEEYWLGKQFESDKGAVDNMVFESLETFLPIATRQRPEPLVESEADPELADKVRKMLIYQSDRLSINLKMKQVARYWSLYFLGVAKVGWSELENDITCYTVRPQKLVLDKDATIEDGIYNGDYIGEEKQDTAANLIERFDSKADTIKEKVKGKLGTKVLYYEWWHDDYVFWTLDNEVLAKAKNPHWNYDTEEQGVDEMGAPVMQPVEGKNHFNKPGKPYVFLSIFNLGKHPHDDTNLIEQNITLQDLVNKRLRQIDKNADQANGSIRVSGDYFTQEQAKQASEAYRKGKAIWVPTGDVNAAISRDAAPNLPPFIYESLIDYRNELRNVFGTRGSTPQGTMGEKTVGGKLITKGQDSDRIGGGVSVYLEQFADNLYNWFVQLMYVYYDEPHTGSILGAEQANEYISLQSDDFNAKLTVSVKDGSMIPKDPISKRNEAIELWAANALDPITLFDRLEFPNPREAAKQLYLWNVDPIRLFPDLLEEQQAQQAQQEQVQAEQMASQQEQADMEKARNMELEMAKREEDQVNKLEQIQVSNAVKNAL